MNVVFYQCARCCARDFAVLGNARLHGFGLAWGADDVLDPLNYVTNLSYPQGGAYPRGMEISRSTNCAVRRLKITDVFHGSVSVSGGSNNWAVNCDAILTQAIPQYIGWQMQHADTVGGGYQDCSVTSAKLTTTFETFRSDGVIFRRCTSVNGVFASNSSGNFAFIDPKITIRANSQWATGFSPRMPIISVNSNISPPNPSIQQGGTILRPRITQQGYVNTDNDVLEAIVINPNNPNITVQGTPATAIISGPDWALPSRNAGPIAVLSTGPNTIVDGIRAIGMTRPIPRWGNIHLPINSGQVRNCIADVIVGGVGNFNNQRNS
jgi:hypothetical protein